MYGYVIMWLVLVIVFAVLESVTVQLVGIWFAVSAVAAMIFALLGLEFWLQLLAFALVAAALVAATRPLARRLQATPR
ncbi:MAG: hypothetical protein LBT36_00435, partial [Oscillospiraceae bacterium]|nr:hypothetical protein [Oscillospiraceae bacterium]